MPHMLSLFLVLHHHWVKYTPQQYKITLIQIDNMHLWSRNSTASRVGRFTNLINWSRPFHLCFCSLFNYIEWLEIVFAHLEKNSLNYHSLFHLAQPSSEKSLLCLPPHQKLVKQVDLYAPTASWGYHFGPFHRRWLPLTAVFSLWTHAYRYTIILISYCGH